MRLSRKALDAYNAAVKQQGGNAEAAARRALDMWFTENPGASIADTREFCIALMQELGTVYGNAAGDAAYALRSLVADAAGIELPDVDYSYEPDVEFVEKTARYQVEKLKSGDMDGFATAIGDAARYFAERGANDTMANLGKADARRLGRKMRFARVPTGATTCPYCCMLASRGFVYGSEIAALNANHRHCDCRIVEGFEGMEVEGYDPDEYYDRWQHPEKYEAKNTASEDIDDAGDKKQELLRMSGNETYSYYASDAERIRDWMRIVTMVDQKEYSGPNFANKTRADKQTEDDIKVLEQLLRQAEDRKLITYGKRIDHFVNEPSEGRDLFVHAALIRDGRYVEVREEIQQNRRKNIDTRINGELVEIKCPISDGKSKNPLGFVKDNFYTAVEQFKKDPDADERELRLLYCTRYTLVDDEAIIHELERFAAKDYVASIEVLKKNGEFHTVK